MALRAKLRAVFRVARAWSLSVAFHAGLLAIPVGIAIEERAAVDEPLAISFAAPRTGGTSFDGVRPPGTGECGGREPEGCAAFVAGSAAFDVGSSPVEGDAFAFVADEGAPPRGVELEAREVAEERSRIVCRAVSEHGLGQPGALAAPGRGAGTGRGAVNARAARFACAVVEGGPVPSAVEHGLDWLARHQAPDGSFVAPAGCLCVGEKAFQGHEVAFTGLGLLPFLGVGATPSDPKWGRVVTKALERLFASQRPDGSLMGASGDMYDHAIGTLALSEAFALTGSTKCRKAAERALAFLERAQNGAPPVDGTTGQPRLGWRYQPRAGDNDTSVTGWCLMAARSGRVAGLAVSHHALEGALRWVERVTDGQGVTGYDRLGRPQALHASLGAGRETHPTNTAIGILARVFADVRDARRLGPSEAVLLAHPPLWGVSAAKESTVDTYHWYYATLALWQVESPSSESWRTWYGALLAALLPHQESPTSGCAAGSWDPASDHWARSAGRLGTTVFALLSLETAWRFENAFGAPSKNPSPSGKGSSPCTR